MKRKNSYKRMLSFLLVFSLLLPTGIPTLAAQDESAVENTTITNDDGSYVDETKENEETITIDNSSEKDEAGETTDETKDIENIIEDGITDEEKDINNKTIDDTTNTENNVMKEAKDTTVLNDSSKESVIALSEELTDGINEITESVSGKTFNIDDGKCIIIEGPSSGNPIEFRDCVFNLTGNTFQIHGELITKVNVSGLVTFDNCTFNINGVQGGKSGNDAALYLGGNGSEITFNNSTIVGTDCDAQVMALYNTAKVTFNNSKISTTGNIGHWSYAMYGGSVLNLNSSVMSATGMKRAIGGGNINAFYSGDLRTNYDAINIKDSTVDFSDNNGGGFAINRVNIHVYNSTINVNNNAGNATNSGVWYVNNSKITMNGNKGHGFSHIGDVMTNTELTLKHNGYAGYYITSDASYEDCKVDIRCNGERLLSYSAGDVWLNGNTATFTDCSYVWLGGVGRKGTVIANNSPYFVAYDLFENKTKGNTEPVLEGVTLSEQDEHILFLNPNKDFDYARGDTEGKDGNNNDDDLFNEVDKETFIRAENAKIGSLTTAQLSHHKYDWTNGKVTDKATPDAFGVKAYECVDSCAEHKELTGYHPNSFDCQGTYVYAPLVGVTFDSNAGNDEVNNMPEDQTAINYKDAAVEPSQVPQRVSSEENVNYAFTGWYTDKECTEKFDFSTELAKNWTTLYAGWIEQTSVSVTKVWDDENNKAGKRPDSVTVTLLANGEETDYTITLNADNNWKGSFSGLDKYANGEEIAYTIGETKVEGYTSKITGDAVNGYVITNTYTPEKDVVNSGTKGISVINTVKTGDASSFAYWILLLLGSVTGIGAVGIRRRK